ncbi:aminoglycoside phosphotransferase family protein [Streptomyces sp. NPDC095602]|uniref:aminoglycoside phosphotransferase family protein n=1 Tax=Streptomyces sp. NPDC095602 TaxID=3155819 RepID=UPI00331F01CD
MPGRKMHDDELDIDAGLVGRLVAARFPRWADLPVTPVPPAGTDNAMFRLGDDLVVRLPRVPGAARQVAKEQRWLPRLAPCLPLAVPVPVGRGEPGEEFPLPWSVLRWLDGADAYDEPLTDLEGAAKALGGFVRALRGADATGGPPSFRGGPVRGRDAEVRAAIRDLGADGTVDGDAAAGAWEAVLRLPQWEGRPVWLHSDLLPGNLLGRDGALTAVIDFGGLGVGDPACDLMAAWTVLTADTREVFRAAADVDDATWARGRGWALCFGLMAEHYYRVRNPVLAAVGHRAVVEALADTAVRAA